MTIPDLIFIASVLLCAISIVRLLWLAVRGRWKPFRSTALFLVAFIGIYATALIAAGLLMPRQELQQGERRCFDDWCVSASAIELQTDRGLCPGATTVWVATVEVSSVARRVQQRAADAFVEIEDGSGRRFEACGQSKSRNIRDLLGPGESFSVSLPFALPATARPAGLVIHHGSFPGAIIVGDDQSWLHKPTLFHAAIR